MGVQTMKIEIALYATLSQYLPPGAEHRKAVIDARDGATVREIMTQLGIPQSLSEHPPGERQSRPTRIRS